MKKKDIRDLISHKTSNYGRGFCYNCYLNGDYVGGVTRLKRDVEEGDEIEIEVTSTGKYRYLHESIRFTAEMTESRRDQIERYRNYSEDGIFMRPDDYQRSKMYHWEKWDVFRDDWRDNKVENADAFVEEICDSLGVGAPSVRYHAARDNGKCAYFSYEDEIRIGEWGFAKEILIHETAHAVVDKIGIDHVVSSHGPAFVSVFMQLLEEFLGYDRKEMERKADARGVDYLDDFDIAKWRDTELEFDAEILGYLRDEEYHTEDGKTFTDAQVQAIRDIREGGDADGRSARALINRGYIEETEDGYEFTPKAEKIII